MSGIPATYASPGLRIGLLLEDHPGTQITYREGVAADFGVPASWGGDRQVVVARVERPGLPVIEAYKTVEAREKINGKWVDVVPDPERWVVLCTKALGRALKRCGYPDDMTDLKALVLWRQRNAEVAAIGTTTPVPFTALESAPMAALPATSAERVDDLDAAGRAEPDEVSPDDDAVGAPDDDGTVPDDDTLAMLRDALAGLESPHAAVVNKWAKSRGWTSPTAPPTEAEAQNALNLIDELERA